jgi:hypothetical protein
MGKYRITQHEFDEAYSFWFPDEYSLSEAAVVMFLQNLGVEIAASRLG